MALATLAGTKTSPVRGRWLWSTLVVIIGTALLVRLGFWQLQRLSERRAQNAYLVARIDQPPLALTGATVDPDTADLRRATVTGTYDYSQDILLRNQEENGVPGVHLITPMRISGSDAAVLVDRGWIPVDQSSPAARAAFDTASDPVTVSGLAHRGQVRLNFISPADPELSPTRPRLDEWFRVDIARIQQQIPYRLLPVYVQLGDPKAPPAIAPPSRLPDPTISIDLSEGPHLSYAIQWFSFAAILLGGYVTFYIRRSKGATL